MAIAAFVVGKARPQPTRCRRAEILQKRLVEAVNSFCLACNLGSLARLVILYLLCFHFSRFVRSPVPIALTPPPGTPAEKQEATPWATLTVLFRFQQVRSLITVRVRSVYKGGEIVACSGYCSD
jgi:hypothetical protein